MSPEVARHLVLTKTVQIGRVYGPVRVVGHPFMCYAANRPQLQKQHYVVIECECGRRELASVRYVTAAYKTWKCTHGDSR